jgi:hypothetical protein
MGRLFKYLLFALAFVYATFTADMVSAQTNAPTPTASPATTTTEPATSTLTATVTANSTLTATTTATSATGTVTQAQVVLPTATPGSGAVGASSQENPEPLQGTIITNRSETDSRFFLEGETYLLEAGRSQGIDLPRASTVLNLFDCAADVSDSTAGCFWDPYLLQNDGFYEIYDSSSGTAPAKLMLREAGAPPNAQIWIQNRTGQAESIVFKDKVHEIQPSTVLELPVEEGIAAILYVRSCLTIDEQSACEWAPKAVDSGVYYAMVEIATPASDPSTTLTTIDLRTVVGEGTSQDVTSANASEAAPGADATPSASSQGVENSVVCEVVVPALNVRSGPGLQYDIIDKVRTTEAETTTVVVIGRSEDSQWLVVDTTVADQGWINNSSSFIDCNGDPLSLPVAEATVPVPTPQPLPAVQPPVSTPPAGDVGSSTTEGEPTPVDEETSPVAGIPPGQSLLVITNGFQHEMRFTIDQIFRPQPGPSEYDLLPGESVSVVVYPGAIAFTGSSPWSGLSGNVSLNVEPDQALNLWLRFELDADGSWVFHWN